MKKLAEFLNIQPGCIISVVGAGGKTSFINLLCQDLYTNGSTVIFTTTTRILQPESIKLIVINNHDRLEEVIQAQKKPFCLALGSELDREGKVTGLPPHWVNELITWEPKAIVLVEADGSRGLPFKAPALHEPVIPTLSSMVIVVAGVDSVGAPLLEDKVHRPEIIAKILGKELGSRITIEDIASVLSHPEGGLKGLPPKGELVFFLNKSDTKAEWEIALSIARALRQKTLRGRILIGSIKQKMFSFYD